MSEIEWTDAERGAVVTRWRNFLGYEMAREDVIVTATLDALAPFVAAREAQAAAKALDDRSARVKAADELATQSPNLTPKAALDLLRLVAGPTPADSLRARLDALSWEMCPQDGKRLRGELGASCTCGGAPSEIGGAQHRDGCEAS